MATRGETHIPEGWDADEKTRAKISAKYPQVDIDVSVENFRENCAAEGRVYRDWQAGFCMFVRKAVENKWFNVVKLRGGKDFDPRWNCIHEARKHGFREPHELESPGAYKTAFEQWKLEPKSNVVNFSNVLKRVPH